MQDWDIFLLFSLNKLIQYAESVVIVKTSLVLFWMIDIYLYIALKDRRYGTAENNIENPPLSHLNGGLFLFNFIEKLADLVLGLVGAELVRRISAAKQLLRNIRVVFFKYGDLALLD